MILASNTARFGLLKKDPVADGNDTFNIQTMLNDNWDKLDSAAKKSELDEHTGDTTVHITAAERTAWNNSEGNAKAYADQQLAAHSADYVKHPGYGIATGSANTYAVTLNPAPSSYIEGMAVSVKISTDNTGPSTININGLGAKAIKKPNGNDVSSGNLKAGSIYTLRYNGTNFILQGEGGSGNAQPSDVLSGKTFTNDSGEQTGTMPNNGAITITPTTTDQVIPQGFHNGIGKVKGDPNLIPSNILSGKSIFGVVGSLLPGRKASGSTSSSSSTVQFQTSNGGTAIKAPFSVSGLSFQPNIIVIARGFDILDVTIYIEGFQFKNSYSDNNIFVSDNALAYRLQSPAIVSPSGFTLPVNTAGGVYSWWAYRV